jgi:putative Mg2+ transporter-C (MgtC) family protein
MRQRRRQGTGDLAIHLRDDSQAVGKTLAALAKLEVPVRRATVEPGAGSSALLRVELGRALEPSQASVVAKRLLTLRYVERVDTAPDDQEAGDPEGDGVVETSRAGTSTMADDMLDEQGEDPLLLRPLPERYAER